VFLKRGSRSILFVTQEILWRIETLLRETVIAFLSSFYNELCWSKNVCRTSKNALYLNMHDTNTYTLSEAWSGVNWADLMAGQGAFGTDLLDRAIFRPKHHAYYRSGRPVIKIGPKGALASHEIRPINSAPSLGQSFSNNPFTLHIKRNYKKFIAGYLMSPCIAL